MARLDPEKRRLRKGMFSLLILIEEIPTMCNKSLHFLPGPIQALKTNSMAVKDSFTHPPAAPRAVTTSGVP